MTPSLEDLPLTALQRTWAAQADAFALGRWSPPDVLEAYARRIARFNPHLNAVVDTRLSEARRDADESALRWRRGEPLSEVDGAVVLVKANIAVEGLPWHAGIKAYERRIARTDSGAVARLKAAGAIILGTLNMEEGALGAVTDNPWLGRCLNPWGGLPGKTGASLTPGGSSGGSGSAVAAGLCVAALGTDTMGSVRIPAAYCGVAGHKPSRSLVSGEGVIALSPTLDHVGPLTRSAGDLSAWMSALAGQAVAARRTLGELTIGRWRFEDRMAVDPAVATRFEAAIMTLEAAGVRIVDVRPEVYDYSASRRRGLLVSEIEGHHVHAEQIRTTPHGFSDLFRSLLDWGATQSADVIEAAYAHLRACEADAERWFEDVDLVVAPTALETSFAFGTPVPPSQADLTAFADFVGIPSTAVPMGLTEAGLPASIQFMGPKGADGRTIGAAAEFERLIGGPLIPPGY